MTDNIIKKLVSLGCLKFNIAGIESYPTSIINGGDGYVTIDGKGYNSNTTIEIISVDVKKLRQIMDSLKFITKFNKDEIDTMSFSEVMSIGILQQMDKMDNDIDRINHMKSLINYNFKDLIDTTPIIMGTDDEAEIVGEEFEYENEAVEVEDGAPQFPTVDGGLGEIIAQVQDRLNR